MSATRRFLALVLLPSVGAACYTSPSPQTYVQAMTPAGVRGVLHVQRGPEVTGELLEVRDSAYVMLVDNRVTVVPFRLLAAAQFDRQDWADFSSLTTPSAATRQRLRMDSRFPFGMRDPALAALLRASGQARPDVIGEGSQ